MKHLLLKLEPVIWLLFGQGILLGTLLLTGWVLVVGLPRRSGSCRSRSPSQQAHALASSPIGRLVLPALIVLPLWKGAHHMRTSSSTWAARDRDAVPWHRSSTGSRSPAASRESLAVVRSEAAIAAFGPGAARHVRAMPGRVLEGIRVLDLTRVVAGPFATAVLADLGADVVKVERPRTGDDYRYGPSPKGQTSLSFQNTNRGKRSITLDLRQPEGRELFLRLVERADVVVENFRAGWLARQGLAPEVIQARNPRCVVASLSGFGATGPVGRAAPPTTSSRRRPAG